MTTIVGRDAELAAVDRLLDRAAAGAAALVLAGEAGIGKTTVWRAGIAAAAERGFTVLRAQPGERERRLSYATLTDLVGERYEEVRDDLPEPQRRGLDAALLRAESATPADPRAIATGLVSVLAAQAERAPVLVAIDDVQWVDAASGRALEFTARRLPSPGGLLLTRRSEAGKAPTRIESALAEEQLEHVTLPPLSLAALHHLLRSLLDEPPARPLLIRIAQASGGNPFFALELARSVADEGTDPGPAAQLPLSERLSGLVLARLAGLSRQADAALLAAAALSRPNIRDLTAALDVDAVRAGLAEAADAGLLTLEGDRIRFSHPLLASGVYTGASAARRRAVHATLARVAGDPEERARHLAQSDATPDAESAAAIAAAAEQSARRGAQDAAAELYRASRQRTPPELAVERAQRAIGEATALVAAGEAASAHQVAAEAVAIAPAGGARSEALFLLGQTAWLEDPGAAKGHLEAALEEAGDDARLRGRIHAKLAALVVGDHETATAHAETAAALLDEREEPGLVAYALVSSLFFGAQIGRGERPELLERALRLEERAGPEGEKSSLFLIWYEALDEFASARARHEVEDRWYRDRGEEGWRAEKLAHRAHVELRAGDWRLAEELAERSCAALEHLSTAGPWGMPFAQRARIDAHLGRIERARETIRPIVVDFERSSAWFSALGLDVRGFVELAAGDAAAAAAAYERLETHVESIGIVCPLPIRCDPDHVEALVALGDVERARTVLARFERRASLFPRLWTAATLPRAQALVAAAAGETDAALACFDAADEIGALPFELARTLLERGRLERRVRRRGRAAASLERALTIFEQLGSQPWIERTQAELARVGRRRSPGNELTATERRIAQLAVSGLTNREIAQAAFVSPKTVESNLARVYRKLGIRSRAELGARMTPHQ